MPPVAAELPEQVPEVFGDDADSALVAEDHDGHGGQVLAIVYAPERIDRTGTVGVGEAEEVVDELLLVRVAPGGVELVELEEFEPGGVVMVSDALVELLEVVEFRTGE